MTPKQMFIIADLLTYSMTKGQPFDSMAHVERRSQIIKELASDGVEG